MAETDSESWAHTVQRATSAPAPSAPGAPPQGDARYELIGVLGEGGMGRVIEAVDKQFSRVVAIKELRGAGGDSARLEAEAVVTGNLEHPGVPPVYERGLKADGTPYYVMRRVRGRSLEEVLFESADLSARLALLPALTRAAQTLGFAHEKGVVHRDVKPQNIMVGGHGEVFVVDWGLARAGHLSSSGKGSSDGQTQAPAMTLQGSVMGTPAYMAPEQARGDLALIDARTDVFALGAVLYRVLTGRPPYDGASTEQVLDRARRGDFPSVDALVPEAPLPLREICKKAMATRPDERFVTAQHLADALEGFASTAVSKAYEKPAGRVATVAVGFGVLASSFGLVGISRFAASQVSRVGVFILLAFFAISMALAWFEYRTRGRLGLAHLGYGMTACCFLSGWIAVGFAVAMQPTFEGAARQAATHVTLASIFAAMALGVWGWVMRARA